MEAITILLTSIRSIARTMAAGMTCGEIHGVILIISQAGLVLSAIIWEVLITMAGG